MSGFQITNRPTVNSANQQPLSQAEQSRSLLNEYKAHITTRNGSTKSGVMFIATSGNERLIKRDGAFSFRNRTAAEFGQATAEIKDHFRQAYQDKVSPQLFDKLMSKLDTYVESRNGMIGTKSFTKFVAAFEAAAVRQEALLSMGSALPADAVSKLSGGMKTFEAEGDVPFDPAQAKAQRSASRLAGVASSFDTNNVKHLGSGNASNAYAVVAQDGKTSIVTVPSGNSGLPIQRDGRSTGEIAAARSKALLPHVAKPIAMVIRVAQPVVADLSHRTSAGTNVSLGEERGMAYSDVQDFLVPADQLERFLDSQPPSASLTLFAVQMPTGAGQDLEKVIAEAPLQDTEFKQLATGMFMGLNEMHSAGLVHRDIKPANLTFDRDAGEVMLIDLGSTQALDANGQTEASYSGMSELFTHPNSILADQPNLALGTQTDRYAFGMTLLMSLAPDLGKLKPIKEFKDAFNNTQQASPDPISGQQWLDALITSLDTQATAPDVKELPEDKAKALTDRADLAGQVRDQLTAELARLPDARDLIEKVLSSAVTGPSGNEAWNALALTLGLDVVGNADEEISDVSSERFAQSDEEIAQALNIDAGANPNVNLGALDEELIVAESPQSDDPNNVSLDQRLAASEVDSDDPYDLAGIKSRSNSIA